VGTGSREENASKEDPRLGLRSEMRYTAARACPNPETIPVLRKKR
jgi:hypothetical protein